LTSSSRIVFTIGLPPSVAIGTLIDIPFAVFGASGSQPVHAIVQPCLRKSALPASAGVSGLFAFANAAVPSISQYVTNLRPRLVTS
jgi:hypothetical protein